MTTFFAVPALATGLAATGLVVAGFAADFFAAPARGATFLTDGLCAGDFPAAAACLTGAFFTGAFFAGAFFATTFLVAAGFFAGALAAAFRAADFGAAFFAVVFAAVLAAALPALFGSGPLLAAAFGLAGLAALAGVLPLCALAAVELALVFAISLHRGWPWRPGVIADVFHTGKCVSGILVPLHAACRPGKVNTLTRLILWLLRLYKRWLSPLLGPRCRFHPSCSDYARIAVNRFGPARGSLLAGWRLLRCQPLCDGGEDPVPEQFHFPRCRHARESRDPP